jgi:hypothetical protein
LQSSLAFAIKLDLQAIVFSSYCSFKLVVNLTISRAQEATG